MPQPLSLSGQPIKLHHYQFPDLPVTEDVCTLLTNQLNWSPATYWIRICAFLTKHKFGAVLFLIELTRSASVWNIKPGGSPDLQAAARKLFGLFSTLLKNSPAVIGALHFPHATRAAAGSL